MRCPICKKEFDAELSTAKPFCSDRCRSIDLGRWLDESYGMPVIPDPEADERPEGDAADSSTNGEPHDD
jgi:uncharacterized protein